MSVSGKIIQGTGFCGASPERKERGEEGQQQWEDAGQFFGATGAGASGSSLGHIALVSGQIPDLHARTRQGGLGEAHV